MDEGGRKQAAYQEALIPGVKSYTLPVTGTDDEVVNSLPPEFWRTSLMIVGRGVPVAGAGVDICPDLRFRYCVI